MIYLIQNLDKYSNLDCGAFLIYYKLGVFKYSHVLNFILDAYLIILMSKTYNNNNTCNYNNSNNYIKKIKKNCNGKLFHIQPNTQNYLTLYN